MPVTCLSGQHWSQESENIQSDFKVSFSSQITFNMPYQHNHCPEWFIKSIKCTLSMKLKFLQFFLRAGGCYNKHLSAFNSRKKEKYRLEKLYFSDSTYTDRERDGTEICAVKVLHVLIIIFCNMLHVGTKISSTLTYNVSTYCACHTILSTVILSCSLLHYAVCKA